MNCVNPECGENTVCAEVTETGLVRRCTVCGLVAGSVPQASAPTAPAQARSSQPKPGPAKTERVNVIALAKAELASLKREIKRLEKLKADAAKLERLLAAARRTNDRGAVVALRKQG